MTRNRVVVLTVLIVAGLGASWAVSGRERIAAPTARKAAEHPVRSSERAVRPAAPLARAKSPSTPPAPPLAGVEPSRFPAPREHGLTGESKRLWLDDSSSRHDIELAHALDVCACPDLDCVRALEATLYARFMRATAKPVDPDDAEAVRKMDTECVAALGKQEYRPSDGSAERALAALIARAH